MTSYTSNVLKALDTIKKFKKLKMFRFLIFIYAFLFSVLEFDIPEFYLDQRRDTTKLDGLRNLTNKH